MFEEGSGLRKLGRLHQNQCYF